MRRDQSSQRGRADRLPANRTSGLMSPFEDIFNPARLFEEFFSNVPAGAELSRRFSPTVDVEENDNEYLVYAELPGVKKEDLSVDCSENQLTISAEQREEEGSENQRTQRRFYGSFRRSFTLPPGVDPDQIKADYSDGVLCVSIPKSEKSRPRRINIGEGRDAQSIQEGKSERQQQEPQQQQAPRQGKEQGKGKGQEASPVH